MERIASYGYVKGERSLDALLRLIRQLAILRGAGARGKKKPARWRCACRVGATWYDYLGARGPFKAQRGFIDVLLVP